MTHVDSLLYMLPNMNIYTAFIGTKVCKHWRYTYCPLLNGSSERRDVSAPIVVLKLKDKFAHELRSLVLRSGTSS